MAGKIIAATQQKGGAGKTTLAAHIAAAAAERKLRVTLFDIDPQGSLTAWADARAQSGAKLDLPVEAVAGHRVRAAAQSAARDVDLVVIDAPPHAETETLQALRAADLALAPLQPSPLDLWASRSVLDAARGVGVDCRFVLNRTPPRAKIVETVLAKAKEMDAAVLKARLGARVAFAAAMAEGLTALEAEPRSRAAEETKALFAEVRRLLAAK